MTHEVAANPLTSPLERVLPTPWLSLLPKAAFCKQVQGSATLQNLARSLAYAQRTIREEPLSPRSREQAQGVVDDLSETLRTILCL